MADRLFLCRSGATDENGESAGLNVQPKQFRIENVDCSDGRGRSTRRAARRAVTIAEPARLTGIKSRADNRDRTQGKTTRFPLGEGSVGIETGHSFNANLF